MPGVAISGRSRQRLPQIWAGSVADHVIRAVWLPDSTRCAVGDTNGGLTVLQRDTGSTIFRCQAHYGLGLTGLACDPAGERLATCGQDGVVRVWSALTGVPLLALDGGAAWVEQVGWSADGDQLAAAAGKSVRIWDRQGMLVREYPNHRATVTDVQWHPRERLLCSTSYGGVTLLDPAEPASVRVFAWQGSSLIARWSPSGRYIATGEQDSTVHFWIVASGKDLQMSGYPLKVRSLAWSGKGRLLATSGSHEVTVWDCSGRGPAGSTPLTLQGHDMPVSALDFRKQDDLLTSGGEDGRVIVWHVTKRRAVAAFGPCAQGVSAVAWSPDGRSILAGHAGGDVRMLAAPTL